MQTTWFLYILTGTVLLYLAAEIFSFWRVRKSRTTNEPIRWDWAWFWYPGITLGVLIVLARLGWGIQP